MEVPNAMVHKIELNPKQGSANAKSKVEEILSSREEMAAQRYSAATLESMAIEAENAAAKLKGEPPVHRAREEDDEGDILEERRDKKRKKLLDAAKALIESGTDPQVVARMMLQMPGESQPQPQSNGQTSILELTEALKNLHEISGVKSGGDDTLKDLIREMRDENKETRSMVIKLMQDGVGGKAEKVDPITLARNQAKAMTEFGETMLSYAKGLGYAPPGSSTDSKGMSTKKTVEELKEENRHAEEMAKLGTEKDYKMSLANSIGELPERIGMGIASQMQSENKSQIPHEDGIEYWPCDCGFKIPISPNATSVTCPKCRSVYQKDQPKIDKPNTNNGSDQ
jgi:hypothetical protein